MQPPNLKDSKKGHPLDAKLDEFLQDLRQERRLQDSTLKLYERELKSLLNLWTEPAAIDAIKKALSRNAPATYVRKAIIWRSFLETCPPPWKKALDGLKLPRLRQKQPLFLTDTEAFQLESACYKSKELTRDRLFVGLALQLGLRLKEILSLRFKDIEGDWIRVIRKGEKEQRLPLSATLCTLLQFWKTERGARPNDWIFPGRSFEEPMSSRAAQLLLKRLATSAGITKKISPHSLRHTFATTLASRGASLVALKELLGHEKIQTTERYTHVTPAHLRETLHLLNKPALAPES